MSRACLHPATLLAGGLHDFRTPATPVVRKPCEDCGATENTYSVDRWVAGTSERPLGHWTRKTVCCGAERDELGRKPGGVARAVGYTQEAQVRDDHERCDHDRVEQVHTHGRGPYATHVWTCPDCGFGKTAAYEP